MRFRSSPLAVLLACLALFASGCGEGPDSAALQAELQAKLTAQFGDGVFKINELARNGSYPFAEKGDPAPRLLIYYKAKLEFGEDYSLAKWNKLNAGALGSMLGASPDGISGIEPEGNKAGDILKVFGTSTYARRDDAWAPVSSIAPTPTEAGGRSNDGTASSTAERWLAELGKEYRSLENAGKRDQARTFEHEIWKARRSIHMVLDRAEGRIGLLTGGDESPYTGIGKSLAEVARARKVGFRDYRSAGSAANCRLIMQGKAEFGISQNDVAALAQQGQGPFTGQAGEGLRAVCSLFPEAVQVVTLASSKLQRLVDLRGKRVDIGPPGSGTQLNALEVLGAHGVSRADLGAVSERPYRKSLLALEAGEVDVVFLTTVYPARPVEQLAARQPIRLIPLVPELVDTRLRAKPFFPKMAIPAHTYPGQDEPVPSLGVTGMVVTRADTPDERVKALLELVFASHEVNKAARGEPAVRPLRAPTSFTEGSAMASFISRKSGRLGVSIPLHPAAKAYFEAE